MHLKDKFINKVNFLLNSEIALRSLKNSTWLIVEKILTMMFGVFVSAIVARHFGPSNFGIFNFALSFVTLFTILSTLGLDTLSVKAIIEQKFDEGTILCTSFLLRFLGGVLLVLASTILIKIISPNESNLHLLVFILSFSLLFRSLEVIEYWIQAHQQAKVSSTIRIVVYFVIMILKIIMVLNDGNLIHFALINTAYALLVGIGLILIYFKLKQEKIVWKISLNYAKSILAQSWYLILSGIMITLYMQMDKIMLGTMLSSKSEVGVYSAAIHIASLWFFVPTAIITSLRPVIMKFKLNNKSSYKKSMIILYAIIIWISIGFALVTSLFSEFFVLLLYGADFKNAIYILSITVWSGIFAMIGMSSSIWLVSEGLQKFNVIFVSSGAFFNLLLNWFLIPLYGGIGAAITTLLTQVIAIVLMPILFKETRALSIMMIKGLFFRV